MGSYKPKFLGLATLTAALISTSALAGGFDRGGVNIDQLFDTDRFSTKASVTYVNPKREIKNVSRPALAGTPLAGFNDDSIKVRGNFWVPSVGIKANLGTGLDCLGTYNQPYGADSGYGTGNVYSPTAVEFYLDTEDYGLTCSYQFSAGSTSVGDAYARIIAGGSYQEAEGFLSRQSFLFGSASLGVAPLTERGLGTFSISDDAWGWRAGLAYEIPDIALRASIVYNSAFDYELTGIQDNTGFTTLNSMQLAGIGGGTRNVVLDTEIPQSVDIKVQSGIREGTLAFAHFRWQEWSKLGVIPVVDTDTGVATGSTLDASYQDGYSFQIGIGQALTENLSALAAVKWDRGTSTVVGTQSDTWTFSGGLRYKEGEHIEISLGGAIGMLTSGSSGINPANPDASSNITYSYDDDLLLAATAGFKYKY